MFQLGTFQLDTFRLGTYQLGTFQVGTIGQTLRIESLRIALLKLVNLSGGAGDVSLTTGFGSTGLSLATFKRFLWTSLIFLDLFFNFYRHSGVADKNL